MSAALAEEKNTVSPVVAKNTRIVATLGPASSSLDVLKSFMLNGVNVLRLNFSHGAHSEKLTLIETIRKAGDELGMFPAILADLQGPKFRTGVLKDHKPIHLRKGQKIRFCTGKIEPEGRESDGDKLAVIITGTEHAHVCVRTLGVGHRVLINDGALVMKVLERVSTEELICEMVYDGVLSEKKGINVPDLKVNVPALTEKDVEDALFALENGVDFIALSFVQRAQDIIDLKILMKNFFDKKLVEGRAHVYPKIVAKIEKPQAVADIDEILHEVDVIMVARGDLGVEVSLEKVPSYQKLLIKKANAARKPVITATQMLESMTNSAAPTRAEVSDVANAVYDGTDAVMLSGESAVGQFPVETVQMMSSIVKEAESHQKEWSKPSPHHYSEESITFANDQRSFRYAIAEAAVASSAALSSIKAIVVLCCSYDFAVYLSKLRPSVPLIVVVYDAQLARFLSVVYGCNVHCAYIDDSPSSKPSLLRQASSISSANTDDFFVQLETELVQKNLLENGDPVIFVSSVAPPTLPALANIVKYFIFGSNTDRAQKKAQSDKPHLRHWQTLIDYATKRK